MSYNNATPVMEIRGMIESDIAPLLDLLHELGRELTPDIYYLGTDEFIMEHYRNRKRGFIKIATIDHVFAGYCIVQFPLEEENLRIKAGVVDDIADIAHVESLAVAQEFRGHGLQKMLIRDSLEELRKMNVKKAYCSVAPSNIYSLRNFVETGFVKVVEKELYGGYKRLILARDV